MPSVSLLWHELPHIKQNEYGALCLTGGRGGLWVYSAPELRIRKLKIEVKGHLGRRQP